MLKMVKLVKTHGSEKNQLKARVELHAKANVA